MKRTEALMNKELDGEITRSELVELDRGERTDPDIRRTRRAWQRTTSAFEALGEVAPRVPVEQWSSRVYVASRPRRPWQEVWSWLREELQARPWTVGACSVGMTAAFALVVWSGSSSPTDTVTTAEWDAHFQAPPPVEIRLAAPSVDDRDDSLVSIRF